MLWFISASFILLQLDTSGDGDHDPHYEPIISLPEVTTSTNEEDEAELIKL